MRIETKNLVYSYESGKKHSSSVALNGVSLTINEGEFFGIIGQTGSGKSTFVQHLNGLIKLQKNCGEIIIGEYNLSQDYNAKELRSKIGMVFQYPEYQLFAETVKEDVAFGLKNFHPNLTENEVEERVREAISLVGLDYEKIKDRSPFELSGGQKRRVAIAGVIVSKPEVLVLDEPAAGLDPKGKKEFLMLLKKLHQTFVKTIVLVSHDMNIISGYCTRAGVFSRGKLIAVGTPKEIFADKSALENSGLSLPTTAYIQSALKDRGINIDSDLTADDFISKILTEFRGDK